ncbi:MAG TPA: dihydropteroate synthase [Kofleriaceae bacterium]
MPPNILVMGVVNVTPDSFSDGGSYLAADAAIAHGRQLLADGADVLDIGGEATNPRAAPTTTADELARILPVLEGLRGAQLSVDTTKAAVARAAIAAGATWINDVSGGLFDPAITSVIPAGCTYICGHLRGRSLAEVFAVENPVTWQDVVADLRDRLANIPSHVAATAWLDPGLGFGKGGDARTNIELIRHAGEIETALGRPVMVGPSRKRFLKRWMPDEPDLDRSTVAACIEAISAGAKMVRVHNVALLRTTLNAYN